MAKIEEVRVDLKFSKEVAENEWMSIGLGATATVSSDETFEMAIQEVEHQLRVEMRQSWGRSRREGPPLQDEAAPAEEIDELPQPAQRARRPAEEPPVDPSWCETHQCKMKMRSWGGYSHKVADKVWCQGHWCIEHGQAFWGFPKNKVPPDWWAHSYEDPDTGEALWCREDGEQEEIQS